MKWPCDKREAHGPHNLDQEGELLEEGPCPGVKAHPNTMIGRAEQSSENRSPTEGRKQQ